MGRVASFRTHCAAATAAGLALALASCGGAATGSPADPPSPSPAPPIRVGAIYNLTGSQASLDGPSLDGALLAVDRINAAGGLLGRRVELLQRDGQSDPRLVRRAARDLAGIPVTAIVGLSDAGQVLAAAPEAARAHIPFVTSGATSPLLPRHIPRWLFLACFGDNAQAAAGAEFAVRRLGARSAAVIYDEHMAYTRDLQRYFCESFRAQGGTIVLKATYKDEGEGGGMVGHMAGTSPDLLFVAAGPQDAGPLLRRLRAAGYHQPLMGGDSFDNARLQAAAAETRGAVYFTTHAALGLPNSTPAMRAFTRQYVSAYGRPPENAFAGLGYDAVNLVARAIEQAGSTDPGAVRKELARLKGFRGVTGNMAGSRDGHVLHKQVTVIRAGDRPRVTAVIVPRHVPRP